MVFRDQPSTMSVPELIKQLQEHEADREAAQPAIARLAEIATLATQHNPSSLDQQD